MIYEKLSVLGPKKTLNVTELHEGVLLRVGVWAHCYYRHVTIQILSFAPFKGFTVLAVSFHDPV